MGKAVVISGCSSGIGRESALYLDRRIAALCREDGAHSFGVAGGAEHESYLVPLWALGLTKPADIAASLGKLETERRRARTR